MLLCDEKEIKIECNEEDMSTDEKEEILLGSLHLAIDDIPEIVVMLMKVLVHRDEYLQYTDDDFIVTVERDLSDEGFFYLSKEKTKPIYDVPNTQIVDEEIETITKR